MDPRSGLELLFGKLAHLYDAGVPLADALESVRREIPAPLDDALSEVLDDIYRGSSLADAFARRPGLFPADVVTLIRTGEQRGELAAAARSVVAGLKGRVLDVAEAPEAEIERVLCLGGERGILHVDADGRVRLRERGALRAVGEAEAPAFAAALARRAGIGEGHGEGALFWRGRVLRVAILPTPEGPSTVVTLSPAAPDPLPGAEVWRKASPGLLVIAGPPGDGKDARIRGALSCWDAAASKVVAVGLPLPDAVPAPDLASALAQDPDVVVWARLRAAGEASALASATRRGVHVVAGLDIAGKGEAAALLRQWGIDRVRVV